MKYGSGMGSIFHILLCARDYKTRLHMAVIPKLWHTHNQTISENPARGYNLVKYRSRSRGGYWISPRENPGRQWII